MAPFIEAQQFKGVWPNPEKVAMASKELAKPMVQRDPPFNTVEGTNMLHAMMQPPPFDGKQSMYFKDGTSFDVQQSKDGRQYMVLPRKNKSASHQQVNIGEWICQLPSGEFISMSDADYHSMTGE